jgi:hypothetical protein
MMLLQLLKSLSWSNRKLEKDLIRFAEIEYKKESPDYIVNLINSGQIFRN